MIFWHLTLCSADGESMCLMPLQVSAHLGVWWSGARDGSSAFAKIRAGKRFGISRAQRATAVVAPSWKVQRAARLCGVSGWSLINLTPNQRMRSRSSRWRKKTEDKASAWGRDNLPHQDQLGPITSIAIDRKWLCGLQTFYSPSTSRINKASADKSWQISHTPA